MRRGRLLPSSGLVQFTVSAGAPLLLLDYVRRAESLGARVITCDSADLTETLAELSGSGDVGVGVELEALHPGLADLRQEKTEWPEVAITRAEFGIAATGSTVMAPRAYRDRLLAQLCRRHIAVMAEGAMVPGLFDAAEILRGWLQPVAGRYVTFVSGPSRTSDIERVLTIGVHGPQELTVVLVSDWEVSLA